MPTSARYDRIADLYVETVGDSVDDPATAALLALVGDIRNLRVLDVACGHGRVSRELARRGARVLAIDLSKELIDRAIDAERDHPLGIRYLCADATSSEAIGDVTFDAVACNYGLSDIDDLDGALSTVQRVLPPGGVFVFSVLHPCFPGSGPEAPSSWPPHRGYFSEGWWLASNPGFRGKVGSTFRMLSTYLNALTRHDLQLDRVLEPPPSPQNLGTPLGASLPWFLAVRAIKRSS